MDQAYQLIEYNVLSVLGKCFSRWIYHQAYLIIHFESNFSLLFFLFTLLLSSDSFAYIYYLTRLPPYYSIFPY